MRGQYEMDKGIQEINRPYWEQRQRERARRRRQRSSWAGLHRPLIAFTVAMAFALMLAASVCDYFGVK